MSTPDFSAPSQEKQNVEHHDTVEEVHLEDAHLKNHLQLTQTLTDKVTNRMKMFSLWIAFGGWLVNFDLGYTGIVYQMQPFNRSFGSCADEPVRGAPVGTMALTCRLTAVQQSIISIYLLFMALGAGSQAVAGSYLGRKNVIRLGCAIICIAAAGMLGSAGTFAGHVVCKYISGYGIGLVVATAPAYGAECTPSHKRGLLVSVYTAGIGFGSVAVALVCLGSHKFTNDWAWKAPIICQIPVALIYAVGLVMFPESPRWLMVHGKEAEARQSFARFYGRGADSPEIITQVQEIKNAIESEKSLSAGVPFLEIFHRRYIRRTLVGTFCIANSSLTGINFVVPYATIFLAGLGIRNPYDITVYLNLCVMGGSLVGPFPVQYLGRRVTFLTGFACMAICMLVFSVTNSALGQTNEISRKVLIAFLCLWCFLYTCFNASCQWLSGAEQHSVRHRTYGQAFSTGVGFTFNFASNFWTPYMINARYGNMGTNVGYFYFGLLVCLFIIMFLVLPETGNLTLEEIDSYYDSGVKPWKTSLKKNKAKSN